MSSSSKTEAASAASFALRRTVLLLDKDAERRAARAGAMRAQGMTVDCAVNNREARRLWKPGSHQMVMIDMRGAAEFHDFYDEVRASSATQRFAFFTAAPPYVIDTPNPLEAAPYRASVGSVDVPPA